MIRIYDKATTSFGNNGLGVLRDCIRAEITEELNGLYDLQIEYKKDGFLAENLTNDNIIKANGQLFRINRVQKKLDLISVYARHIFYDLDRNFLDDVAPTNKDAQSALQWILDNANFSNNFTAFSDISIVNTARYVRQTVTEAIFKSSANNAILQVWGGELERDNFTIKLWQQRGQDRGVSIRYGKNLAGVDYTDDFSAVITRIMPEGANGLLLPEGYIDSPLIENYAIPFVKKVSFSSIGVDEKNGITEEMAQQQLRDACRALFESGADKPQINIKVDWVELSQIEEYKEKYSTFEEVLLGDVVNIYIDDLDITAETRVIKTVYDCLFGKYTKFELGEAKSDFVSSSAQQISAMKNVIQANTESILSQTKDNATAQITQAMGGFVYKTNNELFVMDTADPNTAVKVWRWNLNGLGYSSSGIAGPYTLAMTQDGQIVADFITAGQLDGSLIKANTIKVGQLDPSAIQSLQSALSNVLVEINSAGLTVSSQTGSKKTFIDDDEFSVYNNGVKVLTINDDTTVLKRTNIQNDLTVGHIKHIVRGNGLDMVYIP